MPPSLQETAKTFPKIENVYVFLADTLPSFPPGPPFDMTNTKFTETMQAHYKWGAEKQKEGSLLVAGPLNFDLPPTVRSKGAEAEGWPRLSGLLIFKAASREAAETLANQDPLVIVGWRRNVVHSWSPRFGQADILDALVKITA